MIRATTGDAVQVVRWNGKPQTLPISGTSATTTLAAGAIYRLYSTVDAYVLFGDSSAVADTSCTPISASTPEFIYVERPDTTLACLGSASGTLYITACEV